MLHKRVKAAYLVDVAIPNNHNLHSTIIPQLQKYADLKEELITIRQLKTSCTIPLVLSAAGLGRTNYTKSPPSSTHSNADSSNTQYMPNIQEFDIRRTCIVIYSYNKSQQDALFLNFILVKYSTCFGQTYCPSSGVLILCSQQLVVVILVMLTVG